MTRYASTTSVPIAKSRSEIDSLLRAWGCGGIQWTDDYSRGLSQLAFLWEREGQQYMARFSISIPTDEEIRSSPEVRYGNDRHGRVVSGKMEKALSGRGRQEHRILLLWIKAALNAVEAGIVEAEAIFLPWLVGKDGRTVAEVALPRMNLLLTNQAGALMGLPAEAGS